VLNRSSKAGAALVKTIASYLVEQAGSYVQREVILIFIVITNTTTQAQKQKGYRKHLL